MTIRPDPSFIKIDPLAESTISGLYTKDITQYLRLTKIMLRRYLEECIKEDGQFRKFFDRFATFSKGFVVNEDAHNSPEDRHLQIVDFYSDARERPPQIFIQDNGYNYKISGLGGMLEAHRMQEGPNGERILRIADIVNIDINLLCAALSIQELEDLMAFVSAAFGQFQQFTCNYVLKPALSEQGPNWEIRIPFSHSFSQKTASEVHGDPRLRVWSSTCAMTVTFENSSWMKYNAEPLFSPKKGSLTLDVPDTLAVGQDYFLNVENRAQPISVYSNDPRIALVRPYGREKWIIMPKSPGVCDIVVVRVNQSGKDDKIMAKETLTVIPR